MTLQPKCDLSDLFEELGVKQHDVVRYESLSIAANTAQINLIRGAIMSFFLTIFAVTMAWQSHSASNLPFWIMTMSIMLMGTAITLGLLAGLATLKRNKYARLTAYAHDDVQELTDAIEEYLRLDSQYEI